MQEILRRCPAYGTLKKEDPPTAKEVDEEVGRELLVDLVTNPTLIEGVVEKHGVDLRKYTLKDAFSLAQTRYSHLGKEKLGQELKDTKKMEICTVRGERPTPKGARQWWPGPARLVLAVC
jgi:hypothetical protein